MKRSLLLPLLLLSVWGCAPEASPPDDPIEGERFSIFAPFAAAVALDGDFGRVELERQDDGTWTETAPALPGDAYTVLVDTGSEILERQDPRSRQLTHSAGRSLIPEREVEVRPLARPPLDQLVIYELHLGTFHDAPGGAPGTLASARERLDHLEELGVNVVELMPVHEYAGDFSWGYNPSFPFSVESSYGTPDEMRAFIDDCHARGIAVILDVVHNHWGPFDLPMWCFDGECLGEDNGGAWFFTGDRRESGWGPRPDYTRPPVREFILDSVDYLLNEVGFDGMRWDSTVNVRNAAGRPLREGFTLLQEVNRRFPDALMIAEDLQRDGELTLDLARDGAGFDAQWEVNFFRPVHEVLEPAADADRDLARLQEALEHRYNGDPLQRVIYTESHDEVANGRSRLPVMIDPEDPASERAIGLAAAGAALVFTAPGIPMIFQGQELLEDEYFTDTDPLDWSKKERFRAVFDHYAALIALRTSHPDLRSGPLTVFHRNDGAKVIAYRRGEGALVVLNLSSTHFQQYEVGAPRSGAWSALWSPGVEQPTSVEAAAEPYDNQAGKLSLELPAFSSVVLTR